MMKLIELFKGKKTYLIAFFWSVAVFLHMSGFITKELLDQIQALLLPAGLAALRAGIQK